MIRAACLLVLLLASCASLPSYDPREPAAQGPAQGRMGRYPEPVQVSAPPPAYRESRQRPVRDSKFDFYLGVRSLDEDDWDPVEDQGTFGVEFVHEHPDSIFGFELGVFVSGDTKDAGPIDVRGRTSEFSVGIRKTFDTPGDTVHPYVGAGLAAIRAEVKGNNGSSSAKDDDGSGGLYLHGGVGFDVGPDVQVGFDLRLLGGTDIRLFGTDGTADYAQFAFVLGVRF